MVYRNPLTGTGNGDNPTYRFVDVCWMLFFFMDQKRGMESEVLMKPESVSWQVQRGTRVALLCGATAALTDQQLIKSLDNDAVYHCFSVQLQRKHEVFAN